MDWSGGLTYSMGSLVYVDYHEYHNFVVCCQFIKILGRVELKASETWNIHQFDIESNLELRIRPILLMNN